MNQKQSPKVITLGICLLGSLALSSAETAFPLMSSCFEDARVLAAVTITDNIRVRYSSINVGSKPCYSVQLVGGDGQTLNGFLVGATLPAVARFEEDIRRHVPRAPTQPTLQRELKTAPQPQAEPERRGPVSLAGLKGQDMYGRPVDVNSLPASHVVVYFWSATSKKSIRTTEEMEYIQGQFGGSRKLEIVGVASAKDVEQLRQVCQQNEVTWPQIFDRGKLAERYQVEPDQPYLLLDRARKVVAAVASPRELEVELRRIGLR